MIEFVGHNYQYQGEQLTEPEIIVIIDHHYNEEQQQFPVEQLLKNSQCDPKLHTIIFDHVLAHDDCLQNYNLIYFPAFLTRENREFVNQQIKPNWNNRTRTFNFMINKPRPHRELLLKLIKEFNLTNYSHSLAWTSNSVNDIPVTDYRFGAEAVMDRGVRNGSYKNALTYQGLLQTTVFEPSCISLITEPVFYERETIITEKTLMAMYAGTIPIWVGGWRIADWLEAHGFDTFKDIVDHSYQNLPDPTARTRQAVERNLKLLQNFELAHEFVQANTARFAHNLQLLESMFFARECHRVLDQHTGAVHTKLRQMLC